MQHTITINFRYYLYHLRFSGIHVITLKLVHFGLFLVSVVLFTVSGLVLLNIIYNNIPLQLQSLIQSDKSTVNLLESGE